MFRIVWKSFKYNIKSFTVFFLSAIFTVMMAFGFLYLGQMTEEIKIEGIDSIIGYQLTETIPIIIVVSMCVMAYSVKFYILSRIKDYTMLLVLGIKKKTFILFITMEYLFSWILSIGIGLICGNLFVALFQKILEKLAGNSVEYSVVDTKALYVKVILCCVAFIIGVVIVIIAYLGEKDISDVLKVNVAKEKYPVKKGWIGLAVFGVFLIIISQILSVVGGSMSMRQGGIIMLIISTGGVFLILQFGMGVWYENAKINREKWYYQNILKWNQYYHRMSDNIYMTVLQIIIGMAIIYFVWTVSGGIWKANPEKYPYDAVCKITGESREEVEDICKKYSKDLNIFSYLDCYYVNSQKYGIPASTYKKLTGEKVDLDNDEFLYVWDEWYSFEDNRKEFPIAFGWLNRVNNITNTFKLKESRQRDVLVRYGNGMLVFSDETFQKLWRKNEANFTMITMNMDDSLVDKAEKELKNYKEIHQDIEIQVKKTILKSERMEGIVRFSIIIFVVISLLAYLLFVLTIKIYSELPAMKAKYYFLKISGMKEKDRKKMIKREMHIPFK